MPGLQPVYKTDPMTACAYYPVNSLTKHFLLTFLKIGIKGGNWPLREVQILSELSWRSRANRKTNWFKCTKLQKLRFVIPSIFSSGKLIATNRSIRNIWKIVLSDIHVVDPRKNLGNIFFTFQRKLRIACTIIVTVYKKINFAKFVSCRSKWHQNFWREVPCNFAHVNWLKHIPCRWKANFLIARAMIICSSEKTPSRQTARDTISLASKFLVKFSWQLEILPHPAPKKLA